MPNPDMLHWGAWQDCTKNIEPDVLKFCMTLYKTDIKDRLFGENLKVWVNNLYQVMQRDNIDVPVEAWPKPMTWLSIKRRDKEAVRDWRHFQRIKNELCGSEREAIELYPAESRLMDTANQYHLWVFPPDVTVPLGHLGERIIGTAAEAEAMGGKQREVKDV